jgi:hypothetical protein
MNEDIDVALTRFLDARAAAVPITPDVDEVVRRGELTEPAVARRRAPAMNRRFAAAAAALVAVAGVATVALATDDTSPAIAGWTSTPQPIVAAEARALEHACRDQASEDGAGSADVGDVVAVDIRGAGGLVVFASGASCAATRSSDATGPFEPYATTSGEDAVVGLERARGIASSGQAVVPVLLGTGYPPEHTLVWGVLADEVASVEIETVSGQTVTPVVEGDVWTAFWPEETPLGDDPPVARAYGADGELIEERSIDPMGSEG